MIAMWIAMLGVVLLAMQMAVTVPKEAKMLSEIEADTVALQIYAWRDAINGYLDQGNTINPGTQAPAFCTGGATLGCLTPITGAAAQAPVGWVAVGGSNGRFFIYKDLTSAAPSRIIESFIKMGGGSVFIGRITLGAPGQYNFTSALAVPEPILIQNIMNGQDPGIPANAVAIVGRHG